MTPITVCIVDDEDPAREGVRRMLDREEGVTVTGEFSNGREAADQIARLLPDVLLLDVQMPDLDGFRVLDAIPADARPVVIFLTAHEQYAVKAFAAHAVDYVLKPFSDARFREAIDAARRVILQRRMSAVGAAMLDAYPDGRARKYVNRVMIRSGEGWRLIPLARILWIESADYCARVHTTNGEYLTRDSLERLGSMLNPDTFVRVHRATIVNINAIDEIRPVTNGRYTLVLVNGDRLDISRRRRAALEAALGHDF